MGTGVDKVQGFSHILKHLWTYLGRLGFVCLHSLIVLANEFLPGMDPALQRLRTMEGASPAISNLLPLAWSSALCLFPSLLSSISSSLGPLPRNSNQRPETSPQGNVANTRLEDGMSEVKKVDSFSLDSQKEVFLVAAINGNCDGSRGRAKCYLVNDMALFWDDA
ncbi:hypothetical protein VNO77_15511 [Canavalia gladiata]|uniref:Uncharacterized protein n=1 Tax=Canavalia gladiata TaxID=3824 RepID=A0AAN9LZL4_CANGL